MEVVKVEELLSRALPRPLCLVSELCDPRHQLSYSVCVCDGVVATEARMNHAETAVGEALLRQPGWFIHSPRHGTARTRARPRARAATRWCPRAAHWPRRRAGRGVGK